MLCLNTGCQADRGHVSGDSDQSRSDWLATGPQSSVPAILSRAETTAHSEGNG